MTEPTDLATSEEEGHRCQVCEFPEIAGQVQGEINVEHYSLRAPHDWFNFYDFWQRPADAASDRKPD